MNEKTYAGVCVMYVAGRAQHRVRGAHFTKERGLTDFGIMTSCGRLTRLIRTHMPVFAYVSGGKNSGGIRQSDRVLAW